MQANDLLDGVQHLPISAMNGHISKPSTGGLRDRQGINMPAINTTRTAQSQAANESMQTPGTGFDLNYTPLLPSQLLMGSPFQPGSPATFTSSQFQNFSSFSPNSFQHGGQQNQIQSPVQTQQPLSPQMYQNLMSPNGHAPQSFGAQPFGAQYGAQSYGALPQMGPYGSPGGQYINGMQLAPGLGSGTSRTVYLGNIPPETSAEEILGHVRSGQIESVRLLPDKNCAFISFVDSSSAVHFHSDAILKKLSIRAQDVKIGWGKPSQVPTSVALAVQQSAASRNVYLGNLPAEITEEELREDLGRFGPIDTVKLVREKAIGFVHFLSISNAIKAVTQLPQDPKWQPPRRVFYGKDRCAYISKTQQQNAAQYLGIAPGYAHALNSTDRDIISNAIAQQSVAAAAVATAAGGVNNLGNRTVYLGNIHPETTIEEICNVVRGGLLHHVRYIPDKHICFVTFIDPTAAASFYALSNLQGLMIHNRRLKIGWGKHSGGLPPAIALAVSGGASRNVYIGNIDESWNEERFRQDFAEYGEIELVNALREKSCAFVNFTNIANAIKAIEAIRGKDEYQRFKINFGKDRCGNPPRQANHNNHNQYQHSNTQNGPKEESTPLGNGTFQSGQANQGSSHMSPPPSGLSPSPGIQVLNNHNHAQNQTSMTTNQNPLTQYLSQMSGAPSFQQDQGQGSPSYRQSMTNGVSGSQQIPTFSQGLLDNNHSRSGLEPPQQTQYFSSHGSSNSFSMTNTFSDSDSSSGAPTIGGMLAPSSMSARAQHARAVSLPAFSQLPYVQQVQLQQQHQQQQQQSQYSHQQIQNASFGGLGAGLNGGLNNIGYGLAIRSETSLPRWAEEEVGS